MTLRNQIIRLAHENPVLRPHLLQVLAGSGLTKFLSDALEESFRDAGGLESKVVKWEKGEYDATTSSDHWSYSRDEHYTEDGGGYVNYKYPSKIQCKVTMTVEKMPPNSSVGNVEEIVRSLLAHKGKELFQDSLSDGGDPAEFLTDELTSSNGSIKNPSWNAKSCTVQGVSARFNRDTVTLVAQCVLDVEVDLDNADVELDEPDYDEPDYDDRYGSLRKEVIRLAHEHPEFRKELLPLVVE
jgi:hypothetical protein